MRTRCQELLTIGDAMYSKRIPILSLWQATCEQLYPIRADYTWHRSIGMEFASHLMTGVPSMCHRDLSNSLSAMLRPRGSPWFHARTQFERINKDAESLSWLDWASTLMSNVMYDNHSGFVRATKEGDADFAAVGQCAITIEPNRDLDGILYRCWHLRDVVWSEDGNLEIDNVHRKWNPTARGLAKLFPKTVSQKVMTAAVKDPNALVQCRHIVIPSDEYDGISQWLERANDGTGSNAGMMNGKIPTKGRNMPFVSIYIDVDNQSILEETPLAQLGYAIPRWATISGSQYAYSPASVIAIADARMLQQISLTLLEAGQKSVDPPLKAVESAVQGGVNFYAGGVTWVDMEYDERTGAAIEPLLKSTPNLGWGVDREQRIRQLISEAFYLNQISLPDLTGGKEMTAYETQKRVEEYIRRALPLFEPMEVEYNGKLCNDTFDLMLNFNAFGRVDTIPKMLRGQDIKFTFESPLQSSQNRANSQAFTQTAQLLQLAVQIDPSVRHDLDVDEAFRDAALGAGAPANWILSKQRVAALKEQDQQAAAAQAAQQQTMATLSQGADIAQKIGGAATQLQQGGLIDQRQPQTGGAM